MRDRNVVLLRFNCYFYCPLFYFPLIKMPYRLRNIGQLLFLLPNPELKQKVRILEKLNKRFINGKIGTIFNNF